MLRVCGITDPAEIDLLAAAGVDLVGLWWGVPGGPARPRARGLGGARPRGLLGRTQQRQQVRVRHEHDVGHGGASGLRELTSVLLSPIAQGRSGAQIDGSATAALVSGLAHAPQTAAFESHVGAALISKSQHTARS
jgi:hypothetical protein